MRKLPLSWIVIQAIVALLAASGCALSGRQYPLAKWAMDDEEYAEEHSAPYSTDPKERHAQIDWDKSDASFQAGKRGIYLSGGSTIGRWPAATGSAGVFHLPTSWSTVHCGVMGMDYGGIGNGGIEAGARIHAPTRLTPYLGLSSDLGFSGLQSKSVQHRYLQNPNSRATTVAGLAAIVPEAGVSYWLTPTIRVNAGSRYFIALSQPDALVHGLSLEFVSAGRSSSSNDNPDFPQRINGWENEPPRDGSDSPYFVEADELSNLQDPVSTRFASPAHADSDEPVRLTEQ